jgi:hypothetical protein
MSHAFLSSLLHDTAWGWILWLYIIGFLRGVVGGVGKDL